MSATAKMAKDRRGVRPGWTAWTPLGHRPEAYDALNVGLPTSPGCYELAIARDGEQPRPVYVGRAEEVERGLRNRVHEHAKAVTGDKRFCKKVVTVRRKRFEMFVSVKVTRRSATKRLEDRCLSEWWRYHWNTIKMPWGGA